MASNKCITALISYALAGGFLVGCKESEINKKKCTVANVTFEIPNDAKFMGKRCADVPTAR